MTTDSTILFRPAEVPLNGKWCIYIATLSKASALHRFTFTHSRHQPAHREQPGVLAQGLFNTNSEGVRDQTGNPSGTLCVLMTVSLPLSHCRPYLPYLSIKSGHFRVPYTCPTKGRILLFLLFRGPSSLVRVRVGVRFKLNVRV